MVEAKNDLVFEFASNVMEDEQQLGDPAVFPAVIVEHVPGADILNSYAGLACVEEPNDMITESSLDVAEEEIIDEDDDDITLTVEASCHNGDETIETIEAAEALLNMDSPGPMLDEKRIRIKGGATTVLKAGNSKAAKPKEPVEVAQPSEVLRTVPPTQTPYPTQLFRTIHVVQPVQAVPEGDTTSSVQDEALNSSVQSIRTIPAPAQVPVVVSPGNQHLHTVTLQTVPITTVIASTDPSSGAGSQKFILQAIPSSQPMTVLKENVMLQSQKPGSPPSIVLSPAHVQQVLTSSVQSVCNGTVSVASSPSFSATTPVVTFSPRSSQLVAHPPGTVITSVIKAQETKTPVQEVEKKEVEDNLKEGTEETEPQPQPYVMVVSSSNGFTSPVAVKSELLEPNAF
ncbi:ETS-related transcription factor Elf-1 isoform 2 [Camelus ferus]|nr:ETS-related transcription factor Elf-1 isoform 2 [Camelus ferus]